MKGFKNSAPDDPIASFNILILRYYDNYLPT